MVIKLRTIILSLFLCGCFAIACALGAIFFLLHNNCINFSVLENYNPGAPTIILDDSGAEWTRFQLDKREPVPYDQMPTHLIQAFLAAEDRSFFEHAGISIRGILRSVVVNLYHGRKAQGASTITQQLVKLLFFDSRKMFIRKIKEQICSIIVEYQLTKQQILQTYLNHVYFGCGIYGVQAAAHRFWAKDVSELSIDESAVLAAVICSPRHYCPILSPLSCTNRRNVIITVMHQLGHITHEQMRDALAVKLVVKDLDTTVSAPYLKETLRLFLEDLVGKRALYTGGFQVQTTINRQVQHHAQAAFDKQLTSLRSGVLPGVDGALISLDVQTGAIKALVGGANFRESKWNRVLQARRQMGSTFKPLVYAMAVQKGANFAQTEVDEPIAIENYGPVWRPNNVYNTFDGTMTLARALSYSNNIITIKTLLKTGIQPVVDLAKQCRIAGPVHPYPSIALGCVDATLREVAGMFNLFANDGVYVEPHYIKWVKDCWGNKIYKSNPECERVLSSRVVGQVAKALSLGLIRARDRLPKKWVEGHAISKTGTSDFRTCWFVGSTPELTTAVYIGYDDGRHMGKDMFPLRTAFPIWIGLYKELPATQKTFVFDPTLKEVTINELTGQMVTPGADAQGITILV
ncbi:MAG TPA: transglycosylase domain-containing protein [Candidatus Babeliales bacterium]|nr:transglycosylase domain-containing protein [Candidatus Babeliales bacterium]